MHWKYKVTVDGSRSYEIPWRACMNDDAFVLVVLIGLPLLCQGPLTVSDVLQEPFFCCIKLLFFFVFFFPLWIIKRSAKPSLNCLWLLLPVPVLCKGKGERERLPQRGARRGSGAAITRSRRPEGSPGTWRGWSLCWTFSLFTYH